MQNIINVGKCGHKSAYLSCAGFPYLFIFPFTCMKYYQAKKVHMTCAQILILINTIASQQQNLETAIFISLKIIYYMQKICTIFFFQLKNVNTQYMFILYKTIIIQYFI